MPMVSDTLVSWDTLAAGRLAPSAFEATMLSEGKLYVVLGVVLLIWVGIVLFLLHLERRMRLLEREIPRLQAKITEVEDEAYN
jgi:CcmD family protein|nr:MAG: hypothetical protein KatS3mg041_0065 [Bacteroidota bacterium]